MKTKKYPFLLNFALMIFIYAFAITQIGYIFLLVSRFFMWFGMYSHNLPFEICQIVLCAVLFVVCIMLLTAGYKIEKGHLRIKAWFLDLSGGGIEVEKIVRIVLKSKENKLFVNYFRRADPDAQISNICCDKSHFESLVAELQSRNPKIEFIKD